MSENPYARFRKEYSAPGQEENPYSQFRAKPINATVPQQEYELVKDSSWTDNPIMAIRMFLDGMTYGWSDEAGAAVAAGVAKLTGDEASYSEIYNDMFTNLQRERDDYRGEHRAASAVLELGGAIASPATFIKGGNVIARGAGEGALYGAGSAQEGERIEGAALGGAIGGAFGAAFQGGAKALDVVSRRKIAQELGTGDSFIPLHIAGEVSDVPGQGYETFLTTFYRDIVGKTFGGRSRLAEQQQQVVSRASTAAQKVEENLAKTTRNAESSIAAGKRALSRKYKDTVEAAKEKFTDSRIEAVEAKSSALEEANYQIAQAKLRATLELDKAVSEAEGAFRAKAVKEAVPEGTPDDEIEALFDLNLNEAMARVDELWKVRGFDMINNRDFTINPEFVTKRIEGLLKNDPVAEMMVLTSGQPAMVKNIVESFLERNTVDGKIPGKALSELRSSLGSLAAKPSDAGGQSATLGYVLGNLQEVLNDVVYSQLDDAGKKAFDAQRRQWQHNLALRKSVTDASVNAGRQGSFTPDQWLSSVRTMSPAQLRRGKGVLQDEANKVGRYSSERDKLLTQTTEDMVTQIQNTKLSRIKDTQKEIERLKRQKQREIVEAERKQSAGTAKLVYQKGKKDEIAALEQQLSKLKMQEAAIQQAGLKPNISTFERLFASGILGFGYGTANILTGSGVGRALSSQRAQRALAGQTKTQQSIQSAIPAISGGAAQAAGVSARATQTGGQ